jgi:hypothetical protein
MVLLMRGGEAALLHNAWAENPASFDKILIIASWKYSTLTQC